MLQILKEECEDTEANVKDYFYWFPLFVFNQLQGFSLD